MLRKYALTKQTDESFRYFVNWDLSEDEREILVENRYLKYRKMSQWALLEPKGFLRCMAQRGAQLSQSFAYEIKYRILKRGQKTFKRFWDEVVSESSLLLKPVSDPVKSVYNLIVGKKIKAKVKALTEIEGDTTLYISPLALQDRTITCPQADKYGCPDLWVPDLYGEFCGVCPTCGYHFPLEYNWYLNNLFDKNSIHTFNDELSSGNPLNFEGYAEKLKSARKETA